MKRTELFFTALLVPLDALMLVLAFLVSYYLRDNVTLFSSDAIGSLSSKIQYNSASAIQPFNQYVHYVWYLVPAMLVIFGITGLYGLRRSMRMWERVTRIAIGVSGGLFFILLLFLFKHDFFLPRTTVLYSWLLGIVFVTIGRTLMRVVQRMVYKTGRAQVRVAVIGSGELVKALVKRLTEGWISQYVHTELAYDDCDSLIPQITRNTIDELIVVSEKFSMEDLVRLRNRCLEEHVTFGFLPRAFTAMQSAEYTVRHEVGLPLIEVRPTPLDGWGRIVKRVFDLVVAGLLIVLFSPLYLLIWILMVLTSGGAPVIFRHKRTGRGGEKISISKYRSMRPDWSDVKGKLSPKFQAYLEANPEALKEWERDWKLKNDPRISGIGKVLRATRLDELPQFFDVIRGDLSLVGPRPIIDEELKHFGETARILFHVRPGITGPWQVEGGNSLPYEERVRLNAYYIEHWSLLLDIVILFKTAWVVISGIIVKILGRETKNEAY
jgi:exopolysaccharide biosynthesis polyprenyl glycosylphosphotransferase